MPKCAKWVAHAEMVESVLWDTWFFLIWRCYHDTVSRVAYRYHSNVAGVWY